MEPQTIRADAVDATAGGHQTTAAQQPRQPTRTNSVLSSILAPISRSLSRENSWFNARSSSREPAREGNHNVEQLNGKRSHDEIDIAEAIPEESATVAEHLSKKQRADSGVSGYNDVPTTMFSRSRLSMPARAVVSRAGLTVTRSRASGSPATVARPLRRSQSSMPIDPPSTRSMSREPSMRDLMSSPDRDVSMASLSRPRSSSKTLRLSQARDSPAYQSCKLRSSVTPARDGSYGPMMLDEPQGVPPQSVLEEYASQPRFVEGPQEAQQLKRKASAEPMDLDGNPQSGERNAKKPRARSPSPQLPVPEDQATTRHRAISKLELYLAPILSSRWHDSRSTAPDNKPKDLDLPSLASKEDLEAMARFGVDKREKPKKKAKERQQARSARYKKPYAGKSMIRNYLDTRRREVAEADEWLERRQAELEEERRQREAEERKARGKSESESEEEEDETTEVGDETLEVEAIVSTPGPKTKGKGKASAADIAAWEAAAKLSDGGEQRESNSRDRAMGRVGRDKRKDREPDYKRPAKLAGPGRNKFAPPEDVEEDGSFYREASMMSVDSVVGGRMPPPPPQTEYKAPAGFTFGKEPPPMDKNSKEPPLTALPVSFRTSPAVAPPPAPTPTPAPAPAPAPATTSSVPPSSIPETAATPTAPQQDAATSTPAPPAFSFAPASKGTTSSPVPGSAPPASSTPAPAPEPEKVPNFFANSKLLQSDTVKMPSVSTSLFGTEKKDTPATAPASSTTSTGAPPSTTPSLFDAPKSSKPFMFGQKTAAAPSSSPFPFGQSSTTAAASGPASAPTTLFGQPPAGTTPSSAAPAADAPASGSLFGPKSDAKPASAPKPFSFGKPSTNGNTPNLFGQPSQPQDPQASSETSRAPGFGNAAPASSSNDHEMDITPSAPPNEPPKTDGLSGVPTTFGGSAPQIQVPISYGPLGGPFKFSLDAVGPAKQTPSSKDKRHRPKQDWLEKEMRKDQNANNKGPEFAFSFNVPTPLKFTNPNPPATPPPKGQDDDRMEESPGRPMVSADRPSLKVNTVPANPFSGTSSQAPSFTSAGPSSTTGNVWTTNFSNIGPNPSQTSGLQPSQGSNPFGITPTQSQSPVGNAFGGFGQPTASNPPSAIPSTSTGALGSTPSGQSVTSPPFKFTGILGPDITNPAENPALRTPVATPDKPIKALPKRAQKARSQTPQQPGLGGSPSPFPQSNSFGQPFNQQ